MDKSEKSYIYTPDEKYIEQCLKILQNNNGKCQINLDDQSNQSWKDWRKSVTKAIDLQQIYGRYLTGARSGPGWLECRDPWSPSGDQDPSAGVADGTGEAERGTFHSFITGESISLFDFLIKQRVAKDFNDALVHARELTGIPFPIPEKNTTPAGATLSTDPEAVLQEFNQRHAVTRWGHSVVILDESLDNDKQVNFLKERDFHTYYKNRHIWISDEHGNEKRYPASKFWLEHTHRRTYENVIFDPDCNNPKFYNLWKGFAIQPRQGDWSLFKKHIHEVICKNDGELVKYVMTWMADAVQNLTDRPGVALVLRGERGTGKGIFVRYFGSLFGNHFKHVSQSSQITGKFNEHLKDCLLLFADEAFWAGDKQGEAVLKALITEPTMFIERKGYDPISIKNLVRLIIASNSEWVVPAGMEERRFCVMDVSNQYMQDEAYFHAIIEQMENGGKEAMLYDLLNHDLKSKKISLRQIPQTQALLEQKQHFFTPEQSFWFDCLLHGHILQDSKAWEEVLSREQVYDAYIRYAEKIGISRRATKAVFGKFIKKICPAVQEYRPFVLDGDEETRVRHYRFPSLEVCRQAFELKMHQKIQWEEINDSNNHGNDQSQANELLREL